MVTRACEVSGWQGKEEEKVSLMNGRIACRDPCPYRQHCLFLSPFLDKRGSEDERIMQRIA